MLLGLTTVVDDENLEVRVRLRQDRRDGTRQELDAIARGDDHAHERWTLERRALAPPRRLDDALHEVRLGARVGELVPEARELCPRLVKACLHRRELRSHRVEVL